jgi:hypothetical protein
MREWKSHFERWDFFSSLQPSDGKGRRAFFQTVRAPGDRTSAQITNIIDMMHNRNEVLSKVMFIERDDLQVAQR